MFTLFLGAVSGAVISPGEMLDAAETLDPASSSLKKNMLKIQFSEIKSILIINTASASNSSKSINNSVCRSFKDINQNP